MNDSPAHVEVTRTRRWLGLRAGWYVRVMGANRETMLVSETYSSHAKAAQTAQRLIDLGRRGLLHLKLLDENP